MKQSIDTTAITAATLAATTASKATELATSAANTAAALASKTAETTAIISNDITWMKQSLTGIETTLKEMSGAFVSNVRFQEFEKEGQDREGRIRSLERNTQLWAGGLAILTFLVPVFIKIYFK